METYGIFVKLVGGWGSGLRGLGSDLVYWSAAATALQALPQLCRCCRPPTAAAAPTGRSLITTDAMFSFDAAVSSSSTYFFFPVSARQVLYNTHYCYHVSCHTYCFQHGHCQNHYYGICYVYRIGPASSSHRVAPSIAAIKDAVSAC